MAATAAAGRLRVKLERGSDVEYDLHVRRHAEPSSSPDGDAQLLQQAAELARRTLVIATLPPAWTAEDVASTLALSFGAVEQSETAPSERVPLLSGARIRFAERDALMNCLQAASRGARSRESAQVLEPPRSAGQRRGLHKYVEQYRASFPGNEVVEQHANDWLVQWQETKEKESKQSDTDADGFTVVKRSKSAHTDHMPQSLKKKRKRMQQAANVSDIYRHRLKEKRRDEIAELQRKFQADRQRLQELRNARKFKPTL